MPLSKRYWIWGLLIAAVCIAHGITLSLVGISEFKAGQFHGDYTAIFQAVFNIAHYGHPWSSFNCSVHHYYDVVGTPGQFQIDPNIVDCNQIGIHFHLYIYPLAILLRVFNSPFLLLYVQGAFISVAAFILFLLAHRRTGNLWLSGGITLSFLINPFTIGLEMNEFHFDSFLPLFIFGAALAFDAGAVIAATALLIFGLGIKENFPLVIFGFGAREIVGWRSWRWALWGGAACLFGVCMLQLLTGTIIPALSPFGAYIFNNIYGNPLGASAGQIVWKCISDPLAAWNALATPGNCSLLLLLAGTVGPAVLFGFRHLAIGAALLFINLVSSNPTMKLAWGQYNIGVLAAFYVALVFGSEWLLKSTRTRFVYVAVLILSFIISFGTAYYENPIFKFSGFIKKSPYTELLSIEPQHAVCTDDYLSVFVAGRKELYLTPINIPRCDVVLWQDGPTIWYMKPQVRNEIHDYLSANFNQEKKIGQIVVWERKSPPL